MIRISGLRVELRTFALQDVTLNIESGDYFMLVGPSGSGKTVLLETIAGLHKVTSGKIQIDDRDITLLDSEKRNIGMVYQDCALFPHLSVEENIIFGLKMRREKPDQITLELNRMVQLLSIGHLLPRRPNTLSGGEKQKVALARALVTRPKILLLDEPLGALDPQTCENLRQEISKLHNELKITVLHVTHNFEEAITMGNRIAVIHRGAIIQVGIPNEIFRHPNSEFVARFTMAGNIFSGTALKENDGNTVFITEGIQLITDANLEGPCYASIRPEDIFISKTSLVNDGHNYFSATITEVINKGSILHVKVSLPLSMICLLTRHSFEEMKLTIGQQVYLTFLPSSVHLFHG